MKGGLFRQYTLASFLGSIPGCLGSFMNVSLYIRGMISFGALAGGMIATLEHYLHYHIWDHIIKKHLFRIFLWSFGALLFVQWGMAYWNLETFVHQHILWVLLISAVMWVLPESGQHLVFVMMYAQGLIPFSVLFTSSFVQDGHGMLPMLSYSLKDTALIKILNLFFGVVTGYIIYMFGF